MYIVNQLNLVIFSCWQYPLFTLFVFDSRQHALPVAWIITRSFAKPDVSKWLKALIDRARSVEPGWKVGGFFIDDAAADIDLLRQIFIVFKTSLVQCSIVVFICLTSVVFFYRDIFGCPVLFSLWRIRRSWLRNIVRKCNNIEVEREMFKRLGTIVYNIWGGTSTSVALEQFMLDFIDQTDFMEYFRVSWVPKIG